MWLSRSTSIDASSRAGSHRTRAIVLSSLQRPVKVAPFKGNIQPRLVPVKQVTCARRTKLSALSSQQSAFSPQPRNVQAEKPSAESVELGLGSWTQGPKAES